MQWLELLISIEAGSDFVVSALNGLYFLRYSLETSVTARRVGAAALALICGALALEAVVFLSASPADWSTASATRSAALVAVRSVLLLSTVLISLLIGRSWWRR